MAAEIIRKKVFSMQVCVPEDWTDEQIIEFANTDTPSGTTMGWAIYKGDDGQPRSVLCADKEGHKHLVVDV
jgi:hypothetical protein